MGLCHLELMGLPSVASFVLPGARGGQCGWGREQAPSHLASSSLLGTISHVQSSVFRGESPGLTVEPPPF